MSDSERSRDWRGQGKGKVPRQERFLAEMDAVIPWVRLIGLNEHH